jgi:DNA-binding NtrC family response regulator
MAEKVYPNVLVIDADQDATRRVMETVAGRGLRGLVVETSADAANQLDEGRWDLVLVDLDTAGGEAGGLIRSIRHETPEMPVVAMAASDQTRSAIDALRAGVDEVLVKPVDRGELEAILAEILPAHEVTTAAADEVGVQCLVHIVGRSCALQRTLDLASRVAPTSAPVLLTGESGTGKELVSYLIHRRSKRARGPYVRVNCAALSESLLESELFGHERGAFTGAHQQRQGKFEQAHGGTLLLDEISETGPRFQSELLRVLEHQDFHRVGGSQAVRVNVRVIATTNRELSEAVEKGQFRADLYYRLAGVRIPLPALRERREDIEDLVWHFVNLFSPEVRRQVRRISPATMDLLEHCSWPGNVRQLRNAVRTALIFGEGEELSLEDVPHLQAELAGVDTDDENGVLPLREMERQAIFEALRATNSHQAKAARLLGITDRTLRDKLRRYREDGKPVPMEVA